MAHSMAKHLETMIYALIAGENKMNWTLKNKI